MAINITDFDKIWASTSPLTPYAFTDANYQQGWNFVGATPPARQMWDSLFKRSDEKQQYIVQNFLPLSGGTMTGLIVLDAAVLASRSVDNNFLQIHGGTGQPNGAWLRLNGKDNTGNFQIQANDGVNSKALVGRPTGNLTWDSNTVVCGTANIQKGTESVTVGANTNATVDITFSTPFTATPLVLCTPQTGYAGFFATVTTTSTTGATFRVHNTSSTSRTVDVGWVALSI